jgi:hypothetical protein
MAAGKHTLNKQAETRKEENGRKQSKEGEKE